MYTPAEKLFYTFSTVLLSAAFFVLSPSHNLDVKAFQDNVQQQFSTAAIQIWGDQPVAEPVALVIQSVNIFYQRSADEMMAMLTPAPTEDGMMQVATAVYNDFATMAKIGTTPPVYNNTVASAPVVAGTSIANQNVSAPEFVPPSFMTNEPIYNIVPPNWTPPPPSPANQTMISANLAPAQLPASTSTWADVADGMTGQEYCVGIFDGQVSQYMGPCKNDYH